MGYGAIWYYSALFALILSGVARHTPSYSIKNRSNNPQKSLAANFASY